MASARLKEHILPYMLFGGAGMNEDIDDLIFAGEEARQSER